MLVYFIKINVALAVLYLVYRLCFGRDTLFAARRMTLWVMAAFALFYPLIRITVPAGGAAIFPIMGPEPGTAQASLVIDGITVTTTAQTPSVSLWTICLVVYLAGAAFFLGRFLFQLFGIFMLARRSGKSVIGGVAVRVVRHISTPFSFFGWIFLDPERHGPEELREILTHERTHARELHSLDVVFFDLLSIVLWMNPFAWLMKGAVRRNLEYLADKDVIRSGSDRRQYQYRLLQLSYNQPLSHLANHFSKSQLKKRIAMMNKEQTSRRGTVKYAFILPAVFSLFLLANVRAEGTTIANDVPGVTDATDAPESTTVTGTVRDQDGNPIHGVNVVLRNTYIGTVSGEQGNFSITFVPGEGDTLVFSMVGRETVEASVNSRGALAVVMKEEITAINGITVTRIADGVQQEPPAILQNTPAKDTLSLGTAGGGLNDDEVFIVVEDMPRFQDGDLNQFRQWVIGHIRYPEEAQKEKMTGNVVITFVIEKDGHLGHIEILSDTPAALNNEAVRVVGSSPKWEPGRQRGQTVRVKFTMPIHFQLYE